MSNHKIKYRIEKLGKSDSYAEKYAEFFEGKFMFLETQLGFMPIPYQRISGEYSFVNDEDRKAFNAAIGLPDQVMYYTLFRPAVTPFPVDVDPEITPEEVEAVRANIVHQVGKILAPIFDRYKYSRIEFAVDYSERWDDTEDEDGEPVKHAQLEIHITKCKTKKQK